MAKKPFFSIIIPTYNRAQNLQFALFCILRQTFTDFEIIISDNCSTDNTKEVVSNYQLKQKTASTSLRMNASESTALFVKFRRNNTRKVAERHKSMKILYLRNKKQISFSMNAKNALRHAHGQYIMFHSDDDFLFYRDSLKEIYNKIKAKKSGFIRISYMCLTPDRDRVFFFTPNKHFLKDEHISPLSSNENVLSFIVASDHYFITGLIFKNSLPRDIQLVDSEHAPWIDILLYSAKHFGASFISKPYIIASWSQWRNRQSGDHPVYSLINGRLESESYFDIVKKNLDKKAYFNFLHIQLLGIYVRLFPLIKIKVGNKNLLTFASRIRIIDPMMVKSIRYWIYITFALILPSMLLKSVRDIILYIIIKTSKIENDVKVINQLKELEREYLHSFKNKARVFNFQ